MTTKTIKNIAVIGAGLMGCGIAQIFAGSKGYRVATYDRFASEDDVTARISGNLRGFIAKRLLTDEDAAALIGRVRHFTEMAKAAADADLVIECIPEDMAMKQELFCQLEKLCRAEAILATNTSVMSITEIASRAKSRHRIVGTHFWNPPYLIPLVEVVKSDYTDETVVEATMEVLQDVGKSPVRVNRDVPGFLANRLQHALWREAFSIIEQGIADAATVDKAIRMGFGLRLPVLGPVENTDMVGTDLVLAIHEYLFPHLENSTKPSPVLSQMVANGDLGFKSGKGFLTWDAEKIQASRDKLTEHLLQAAQNASK
ncbi:MAG: 3-hydroxyacyl-CoA dehydrogenase family protein [Desulfopila sp.]